MATVSYRLEDLKKAIVGIGYVGENDHMHVLIDCKEVFDEYPDAVPTMAIVPPVGEGYPKAVTRNGDVVEWLVKDSDVTVEGDGEFQLSFTEGEIIRKSVNARFRVKRSISGSGSAPSGVQDWLTDANEKLAEVEEATRDAEAAASHQPYIGIDGYWYTWNGEEFVKNVKAQGEKGDPGDPGSPGDPTQLIDDTQKSANKTYSSNKVDEELTSVKTDITKMTTATASDVGKALSPKTIVDGEVTEWQFKSISGGGGSVDVDDDFSTSSENPVQNKVITAVVNDISEKHVSPNLYDKNTCNPQDGKVYNNSHQYTNSSSYAVTGKMPVQPSTKYKFWAGEGVNIKYVCQWSGETGDTFVSETNISGAAFTTGANTTFVEFEIFAKTHTTDEYNAAIACAMLVEGETIPETYQPYGQVTYIVPTDAFEDAEAVEGAKNYTVMRSLVNIYDKSLAVDNKVFNTNKLVDSTNYAFTGLIPVEPDSQYCFSIQKDLEYGYISAWYQRWDSSKTFIDEVQGDQSTNFLNQIQTTATTAYISFCIYFGAAHTTEAFETAIDTVMVVEGCQEPAEYVPYNLEPVMNHKKLDTAYRDNADRFKGKRWLAFGTSVTYQDSKYYTEGVADGEVVRGYIGNVVRRKPMVITNSGVSGSTLAGSDANSLINRYDDFTYTDYDFVTIEYGINDFGNDVPVGSASDAAGTSTFAACLKTIIEYILTENPIIGLIICTDPDVRGTTLNNNSNMLKDYADVMLEIAAQYRLPVCDWFYKSGINTITKGNGTSRNFLTQSGTHPSVYGHMRMGAMLNHVFDSLLC